MSRAALLVGTAFLTLPTAALAQENISYSYDARGRLIRVERQQSGGNVISTYEYDKANNRTSHSISGAFLGEGLGPELVDNGNMASGTARGWTPALSANLSVVDGALRVTNGAIYGRADQAVPTTPGARYRFSVDTRPGSGSALVRVGATPGEADKGALTGSGSISFIATHSTTFISLMLDSETVGGYANFDNVSLKPDPEIVNNGTFTGGTASNWTPALSASLSVVEGALRVTNGAIYGRAYQAVPTTLGARYRFSVEARPGTGPALVRVGATPGEADKGALTGSGSISFIATQPTTYIALILDSETVGAHANFDNVSLKPDPEIVNNGAFTDGTASNWTPALSASLSVVDGALRVTNGAIYGRAYQAIPTTPGARYRVSVDVRPGTGPALVRIGATQGEGDRGQFSASDSLIFTATQPTTYLTLIVDSETVGAYAAFDNVSVIPLP